MRLGTYLKVEQTVHEAVEFTEISTSEVHISCKLETIPRGDATPCPIDLSTDCTPAQRQVLEELFKEYLNCFAANEDDLGLDTAVKHVIELEDPSPVHQPYRRVPPNQFQEVKEHINNLLQRQIIQESTSPFASPVVLVRKKDGKLRLCVDYRLLNNQTKKYAYPLPRIEEALDRLHGAKYFSSMDLASGYHQNAVEEKDRHKTAFTTPFGLYEYTRMPFGLCNAPATFSQLMQSQMHDLIMQIMLVSLDDILVFSSTFEDHVKRLEMVLKRLRSLGLKLNPKKCHFLREEVRYIGHTISAKGVSTDEE
jgi:Reverse transcriptase (RNA-dependent DNA polymerase)/RNase H-like domain found in reverse transcriptase